MSIRETFCNKKNNNNKNGLLLCSDFLVDEKENKKTPTYCLIFDGSDSWQVFYPKADQ